MRHLEILPPNGTPRSRLLALTLFAVAIFLVVRGIVLPLARVAGDWGPVAEKRAELVNHRRIAARHDELVAALAAISAKEGDRGDYLQGATAPLAEAALQSHVGTILQEAGGSVASSEAMPVTMDGEFSEIGVRFRFNASHTMLRQILYAVESDRPRLFVESLGVQRGTKDDDMSVSMSVSGYLAEQPR